ncbi:glycosyltransferase [Agromyces aerolatus]|uniref:glycosyltransferase n=1 Tax=Agromyces sp. LY-1074 TaxID=3074080 RepID=UPI0028651953|nr:MULTISPECIES: glycosyltransferase [unclassified Agromyces]MDR5698638.1 glycosyltransferase [Agromyces sp. LY-1074]MDR5704932.1 glycosyltransferase [Agromyces sp. LY-1358]
MADAEELSGGARGLATRRLAPRRLALTWSIPDGFGGMTSALLHRSRALAAATAGTVDVLTFDPRPGYDQIRLRLTELGELTAGVRLRNLYEELATLSGGDTAVEVREVRDASGELDRLEHRRADGSLAVLDERAHAPGARRRISAFDADGTRVGVWPGAWACYAAWIDRIVGDAPTVAVVDSKTMAPFAAGLGRPNLAVVHVVHASHLDGSTPPYAPLRPSRAAALAHLERFDAVVFLTERQRADAVRLLGDPGNLVVIPNGRERPGAVDVDGSRNGGVVVAGLTARKRVGDAIEIAALAASRGGSPVALTIVGDGPERERLERLAADASCEVAFTGHRPDGAAAFAEASWMLLTSRSEGSPLVLAEAMARGCVPIAYDVPYGPADLIEHGVNGFLVPDGDREAAAAAILRLSRASAAERAAMREAARRTAERFDDAAVTGLWLSAERDALARAGAAGPPLDAEAERLRVRLRRGTLRLVARIARAEPGASVFASFRTVGTTRTVRRRGRVGRGGRIGLRLDVPATALLMGPRRAIEVSLQLGEGRATAELPATRLHPDRRGLPRRVLDRLRR